VVEVSNRALTWAFEAPLDSGPKFVLVALADHAADHSGEDWTCFPSTARLVAQTGASTSTVERHLKLLEREGWISRTRRRRKDGTLGIYDFTLHRDVERRAELAEARASRPPVNLTCGEGAGPPVKLEPTTRQNGASPPVKLTGQEPLGEPLEEPSTTGAREAGSEGFEGAVAAWPESGRKRTDWRQGRAAWAWACGQVEPGRLFAAVTRCAADPEIAGGDFGWPGLHTWLSGERWRFYLGGPEGGEAAAGGWAGPAGLREAVVAANGEAFCRVALDKAGWDGRAVRPLTPWAHRELGKLAGIFEQHGVELLAPTGDGVRA
jgi:hypothetical protein